MSEDKRLTDEQLRALLVYLAEVPGAAAWATLVAELLAARERIAELEGLIDDMDLQIEDMHDDGVSA